MVEMDGSAMVEMDSSEMNIDGEDDQCRVEGLTKARATCL